MDINLRGFRQGIIEDEEENDTCTDLEEEELKRKKEQVIAVSLQRISHFSEATIGSLIEIELLDFSERITKLQRENNYLQQQVEELQKKVSKLMESLPTQKTIILREINKAQAKQEIKKLFTATYEPLYYSDIAEELKLDLEMVVEICQELIKEGEIEIDTDTLRYR